MMHESERNEFMRRFQLRQAMFLEAVRNAIKQDITWQIYLDTEELHDDGRITFKAVPHGSPSTDSDTLLRY